MGPSIHPRFKKPVGQRLALGALQTAYQTGLGAFAAVVSGCTLTSNSLTVSFKSNGRKLGVRKYNTSNPALSATSVLINGTKGDIWMPVNIMLGTTEGTIQIALPAGAKPTAVRYAWGGTGGSNPTPNGDDVSCCEGDGVNQPCLPVQCPLITPEPLAPFGALPVDPFLAEIVGGKCLCPEPQMCSE